MRLIHLLYLLLLALPQIAFSCQINTRVPLHSAPPAFVSQNNQWQGLSIELIKIWLNQAGCEAQFIGLPFKRGLTYLQQGKIDLMLHLNQTPERDKHFYFIGPIAYEKLTLFTRSDNQFEITSLPQLVASNEPIAIQRGLFYGAEFDSFYNSSEFFKQRVIKVNHIDQLVNTLKRKRTLGFLFSTFYGRSHQQILDKLDTNNIKTVVISQSPVYFALSKQSISAVQLKQLELAFEQVKSRPPFKHARDFSF